MLGRASGPSLPLVNQSRKYLQTSYNELHLPWLCPSFYGSSARPNSSRTLGRQRTTARPKPSKFRPVNKDEATSRRGLASAAIPETYGQPPEDFIPFVHGPSFLGLPHKSSVEQPKPLIVDSSCISSAAAFRPYNGISGQLDEIHQTLHACLQVGRLERAAALVRRLSMIYKPTAPGLLAAHTEYMRELAWRITKTKDQQMLKDLQKWFEVEMRRKGVPPDTMTYALMIQASLSGDNQKAIPRTIWRYRHLAEEAGIHNETLMTALTLLEDDQIETFEEFTNDSPQSTETVEVSLPDSDVLQSVISSLPEVKPVPQKGLGLASLRQALSMFRDSISELPSKEDRSDKLDINATQNVLRQRRLEKDTYESAIGRWREESARAKKVGVSSSLNNSSMGALMWEWHEALVSAIKDEVQKANEAESKTIKTAADRELCQHGPFLQLLPPEKISAATILAAMTMVATDRLINGGIKLSSLVSAIGQSIQDESLAEAMFDEAQRKRKGFPVNSRASLQATQATKQRARRLLVTHPGEKKSELLENLEWSSRLQVKVGSVLLSRLIEVASIDVVHTREDVPTTKERQPVFYHTFRFVLGKRCGFIQLNKVIIEKMSKEPVKSVLLKNLPMITEPKPWTGFRDGGFLENLTPVLRIRHGSLGRRYGIVASDSGDLDQSFAGLTVLGKTPWRINRPVFETMVEAWNTGDAIAKIPPLDPVIEQPPMPSKTATDYSAQRLKWLRQLKAIENHKSGLRSNRCFQNFQIEIARAYVDQTFYFPHNLDFRGRAYPMSPLFNHMGADNVRGLLTFAKGKELGATGLRWLKIHLANVYGFDKASFTEREEFANEHRTDIYDAAENPLSGGRWWLKAEDPWQCLAACIELKNALDSENPHRFVSRLAIHQDGTCNGLQHYAALGGDTLGARQVNLEPGDRPSDIYTGVAELVKAEISKDAAHGNATAKALDGIVTRKVVKQTVMTNVYGVTFLGAQRQVRRQLDEINFARSDVDPVKLVEMAHYITVKIFAALSTMFTGAHDIQYWLGNCANRISQSLSPEQIDFMLAEDKAKPGDADYKRLPTTRKRIEGPTSFKTPVIWTNPLRMPVVQPYRSGPAQIVSTNLQNVSLQLRSPSDPVSRRKQFQAFPPNFIHSLDASHMVLTALMCDAKGLTFAAVHDSFWTHATDVDAMNGFIRDSFVKMHSENIVDRLAAEFSARYRDYIYVASVKASSVIGRKIQAMRKSAGRKGKLTTNTEKLEELRTERLRSKLLASDNPKEREQGASMVTAASIFEQSADEKDILPSENLEAGIGEMTSARAVKLEANEQLEVGDLENAKLLDPRPDDSELETVQPSAVAKKRAQPLVSFWMRMTFPPVPKKVSTSIQ
ncbi:MAG: hypothetical protein Q9195_001482 [Heterodermia aff. obscurata]